MTAAGMNATALSTYLDNANARRCSTGSARPAQKNGRARDSTAGPLFDERAYERTVPGPGRDKWCVSALAIDVMHRKEKFADHETA